MRVIVQIRIEGAAARPVTVPLHTVDRACGQVQDVGLVLGDAKSILGKLQQTLVRQQLECYLADRRACPQCGKPRAIKGYHPLPSAPPSGISHCTVPVGTAVTANNAGGQRSPP